MFQDVPHRVIEWVARCNFTHIKTNFFSSSCWHSSLSPRYFKEKMRQIDRCDFITCNYLSSLASSYEWTRENYVWEMANKSTTRCRKWDDLLAAASVLSIEFPQFYAKKAKTYVFQNDNKANEMHTSIFIALKKKSSISFLCHVLLSFFDLKDVLNIARCPHVVFRCTFFFLIHFINSLALTDFSSLPFESSFH